MKKQKQPKKKKTFRGLLSKAFLIFAILFFLLAVAGIADGIISVFIFCLLCGLGCLYVCRLLKKNDKINEQIAAQDAAVAEIKETVIAAKAEETKPEAADQEEAVAEHKESIKDLNTVEIVYPDGHIERRYTFSTIDADEGCLITDGGHTYHTDVGCFYNWSEEYRENFAGWQLISIREARRRGLRKCKFCIENDTW